MGGTRQETDRALVDRGSGRVIGFGASPVLPVIDFVRGFTDPALPLGAQLDPELEATCRLLATARARDVPVLFRSAAYDDADLADAGIWAKKRRPDDAAGRHS